MGSYFSTTSWAIYGRCRANDLYDNEAILSWTSVDETEAMGIFKREVYAFALNHRKYGDFKCIYLYLGGWRIVRCQSWPHPERNIAERIQIDFRSLADKKKWYLCEERLGKSRWPLCERMFQNAFRQIPAVEDSLIISYAPF